MATKKKRNDDMTFFIGFGLFILGIVAIGLSAFLNTDEGKAYDVMTIDVLQNEMQKEIDCENYEKAALIRDLIKSKRHV